MLRILHLIRRLRRHLLLEEKALREAQEPPLRVRVRWGTGALPLDGRTSRGVGEGEMAYIVVGGEILQNYEQMP